MSERLSFEVSRMAIRLGDFIASAFPQPEGPLAQGQAFLRAIAESHVKSDAPTSPGQPLDRLAQRLALSSDELDLLLLAGMPEEHEGYAAVFRTLHPRGEPRPSTGLLAQMFAAPNSNRHSFRSMLESAPATKFGLLRLTGDGPFFEKSLEPADSLWPVLHGDDSWPASLSRHRGPVNLAGLEEWLAFEPVVRARHALGTERPCTILVTGDSDALAFQRGLALVKGAEREPAAFTLFGVVEADKLRDVKLHTLARHAVPVLRIPVPDGPSTHDAPSFDDFPDTAVLCGRTGTVPVRGVRPLLAVPAERLTRRAHCRMWHITLPELADEAHTLSARYPVDPTAAAELAADLRNRESLDGRKPTVDDVAEGIRARSALSLSAGIKLVRPRASWKDLVLAREREDLLRAAISRLELQPRVLEEWGFLKDRPGAHGVRMLFSGPSGTGKTLSAEVIAGALGVDLLLVDISRVVSKWIGETEKNLSAVFDAAEGAQAVLFFDEADALFGRRTEVSDAHDRYANLETAYLLSRLEQFEGLSILATNLRQNIDPAFLRRLEFVVDFHEPDREERFRLWRCHIPNQDLLDVDINLYELAALYPVVGAFIRNAATAAAFLAAADGGRIHRNHFIRAIRREYEKSGKAFPGVPAGLAAC